MTVQQLIDDALEAYHLEPVDFSKRLPAGAKKTPRGLSHRKIRRMKRTMQGLVDFIWEVRTRFV